MKKACLLFLLFLSLILIPVNQVLAYSGSAAVSYADSWALSFNTGKYPKFTGADCTNFVSQCLYEGGKAMDYSGSYQWWLDFYNFSYTNSWSLAMELYNYFVNNPAGSRVYFYNSYDGQPPNYVSSLQKGDIIFYDWGDGNSVHHSGIVALSNGTDPSKTSWTGTLQDQHSEPHYHAIWHLYPYNAFYATTVFRVYRPS